MIGSFFMAIFVRAPPKFCLMKIVARKFNAKNRDFEIAVTFFVFKARRLGKVAMTHNFIAFEDRNDK